MLLSLNRPLVVFDLESTGTNFRYDRVIEVGAVKMLPDGTSQQFHRLVNPERPIPPEVVDIHGIRDEDVADLPPFYAVAGELMRFLHGCDLGGFGVQRFDIPLLAAEFSRLGVPFPEEGTRVVDAQVIFHRREPRTLSAALAFYCGKDHSDAHSALGDVAATVQVIEGELARYEDLPRDVEELAEYCAESGVETLDADGKIRWSGNEAVLNFGQKSGLSLRELAEAEPGYLKWMLKKDFSTEVKAIVKDALKGRFPRKD